jgi:nucleoside-diphosphate-sugar epimerase
MKKILILGSSGQIGAYLCDYLKLQGNQIIYYDKNNGYNFDLRYPSDQLNISVKEADFVFFLAFDVGGSRYLAKYQHTYDFVNNNALIMTNVFQALHDYKKPFIFSSSQMSNMFYSPYGVMKAVGEQYTHALNGRIVKFWNVYGVEHDLEKAHVITDFILKAKNTGVIDMLTDGQEEREFLYAEDCCQALEMVMNKYDDFTSESELHITSFQSTKIIDIANQIANYYNAKVVLSENIDNVQRNKKNIANRLILNYWQPKVSIKDGVDKIIKAIEES